MDEEQARLFEVAQTNDRWLHAYTAAILGAFCGMRGVEIRHLQWKDVDLDACIVDIRRSKTPAGWRSPTLNSVCRDALSALKEKAHSVNAAEPVHYCFPTLVNGKLDPTRHVASWRSAWRSIRRRAARNDEDEIIYPNLEKVRCHDLRHHAVTVMCEKGLPEHVIMAQVGHISPEMLKHYSHVRRQALNAAAAALEPTFQNPQSSAELAN